MLSCNVTEYNPEAILPNFTLVSLISAGIVKLWPETSPPQKFNALRIDAKFGMTAEPLFLRIFSYTKAFFSMLAKRIAKANGAVLELHRSESGNYFTSGSATLTFGRTDIAL